MISALLSSTKPVAAAARPVNAFSSEITTGMSAPPIGSTTATPKTSATAISSARAATRLSMPAHDRDAERDDADEQSAVDDLLARERDRPAGEQLLQLRERDHASRRS